ncbi:MAG TPA: hypothetical protein VFE05_02260 [Longimicrobiaceae bacterium]|jgi:hypothetical protein|nr:hypothetical protein [Longimicrobiaceae bacterium]
MLEELFAEGAEFLVIGAFALAAHGMPRATGDMDFWLRPDPENASRVWRALARYGAPISNLTVDELARPGMFYQIGVVPARIDMLTEIDGVTFEEAWAEREYHPVDGVMVPVLSRKHLLANKRATGRPKDVADVIMLEEQQRDE